MTLEEALARARELGHDMPSEPVRLKIGGSSYICNNGTCWTEILFADDDTIALGSALMRECRYKGWWQREQQHEQRTTMEGKS